MDFLQKFATGLTYDDFLKLHATDEQRRRWNEFHKTVELTDAQRTLLGSFVRRMPVLVVAGAWCGDCVNQCPILGHFAAASDLIDIRYFDRDADPELAEHLSICGGRRVPAVLFLSEDGYPCGRYGDRTLSKYRQLVNDQSGVACPTGLVAHERSLTDLVVQDWLDEFERIQWILRTSSRLRQKHGD